MKNRYVLVVARTINKEKIDDWYDYWYYCKIKLNRYGIGEDGPDFGWIYGALLEK